MIKKEFYFDSNENQSKIHGVRYMPDNGQVKCVVQIIHGMAEYIERYEEFATFLVDRGCVVTGLDHLGHGKSLGKDGIYGYFCEQDPVTVLVQDTHRLKKITQQLYPTVPYIILGHSMGSFVLTNYITEYGNGIDGAIIMGTGMQPKILLTLGKVLAQVLKVLKGSKHVSVFLDKVAFGSFNNKIMNPRTEKDWLSNDEKVVDSYIADPLCGFVFTVNGFLTLFNLMDGARKKKKLKKIPGTLSVLLISGGEDPVGDYGKGVQKMCGALKSAGVKNLEIVLYEGKRHELLNELGRKYVMEDIFHWIQGYIQQI